MLAASEGAHTYLPKVFVRLLCASVLGGSGIFVPSLAFAASDWSTFFTLLQGIQDAVSLLIPLVFTLILLAFLWGLVKFVWGASSDEKAQGKAFMFWGVVALFVAASVWGIVALLMGLFGVESTGGVNTNPTIQPNY